MALIAVALLAAWFWLRDPPHETSTASPPALSPEPTPAPRARPDTPRPPPSAADDLDPSQLNTADVWDEALGLPRPLRTTVDVLSNGLTVWIVEDHAEPVVAARVALRVGAADEPGDQGGLAHLVEHLVFQGTDRLGALAWDDEQRWLGEQRMLTSLLGSADLASDVPSRLAAAHAAASQFAAPNELMALLDQLGATDINGITTHEVTSFSATLPANEVGRWATVMAEAVARPVFRGFVPERAILEHEADLRDGNHLSEVRQGLLRAMYGEHPYGRPVGGTAAGRARIDLDAAADLHERYYRPNNALVVLVGDVDRPAAVATLQAAFAAWRPAGGEIPRAPPPVHPRPAAALDQGPLWMAWPIPPTEPPEIAHLLAATLKTEVESSAAIGAANATVYRWELGAALVLRAVCHPSRLRSVCVSDVRRAIQRVRAWGADQGLVRAVARSAWTGELRVLESPRAQADVLVRTWGAGEPPEAAWEWIARLRAVSAPAVQAAAESWLVSDGFEEAEPAPTESPERPPAVPTVVDGAHSAFFDQIVAAPTTPLAPAWRAPGADWTVSAGGSVVAARNPRNSLFQAEVRWPLGWWDEPLVCLALGHWANAVRVEAARRGVKVLPGACEWDHASLILFGPDEYAPWAFANALPTWGLEPADPATSPIPAAKSEPFDLLQLLCEATGTSILDFVPHLKSDDEATSLLRELAPEVAYSGGWGPEDVAGWLPGRSSTPPAPWPIPELTEPLPRDTRLGSGVRALRVGEPYEPRHEGLYVLYERWLEAAVFETVRTRDGVAYAPAARFERGRSPGLPNLTLVSVPCDTDWKAAEAALREVLSTQSIAPDRWEALLAATRTHTRSDYVPFRAIAPLALRWRARGLPGDARQSAFEQLSSVLPADLDAFLATEAARPVMWSGHCRGVP